MNAVLMRVPPRDVPPAFTPLLAAFLDWARVDRGFSAETISTYRRGIERFISESRAGTAEQISVVHVLQVKRALLDRDCSGSYIAIIVLSLRCFLLYCRDILHLPVMDPMTIKPPSRPRRQVKFLTADEVQRFVGSIALEKRWLGHHRVRMVNFQGMLYRALTEVLLGSGMRISEALSLRRSGIDWVKQEARVVGKGGKERTAFFTNRALFWLRQYDETRTDSREELFVTALGRVPVTRQMVVRWFGRQSRRLALVSTAVSRPVGQR